MPGFIPGIPRNLPRISFWGRGCSVVMPGTRPGMTGGVSGARATRSADRRNRTKVLDSVTLLAYPDATFDDCALVPRTSPLFLSVHDYSLRPIAWRRPMPLDRRIQTLFGIDLPSSRRRWRGARSRAGDWRCGRRPAASAHCPRSALPETMRAELALIRQRTARPAHQPQLLLPHPPAPDAAREQRWRERLGPYYRELGIDPAAPIPSANRRPSTRVSRGSSRRSGRRW